MDWASSFYSTRSSWFGPTGIFREHRARAADLERLCGAGPKRILDLGAGSGGTAAAMADLGHTVLAVEISPVRATHARALAKNRPNLTLVEANFYSVTLDGTFDVVCCWDGFGVGDDADQRRLLQRIHAEWLAPHGTVLLDVFSPSFWTGRAGQSERIDTVSRCVRGEVQTVRLEVPVVAKYGFDSVSCRFHSEWWPEGQKEETITESIRCYTPEDFLELLEGTGLVANRFEAEGKQFDPTASGDAFAVLANTRSYCVRLIPGTHLTSIRVKLQP